MYTKHLNDIPNLDDAEHRLKLRWLITDYNAAERDGYAIGLTYDNTIAELPLAHSPNASEWRELYEKDANYILKYHTIDAIPEHLHYLLQHAPAKPMPEFALHDYLQEHNLCRHCFTNIDTQCDCIDNITTLEDLHRYADTLTSGTTYTTDDGEYIVYNDDDATKATRDTITETLYAFNTTFLQSHITDVPESAIIALQLRHEDGNVALKRLIDDFDHFIDDAIACDGRGHFLASYDFEEHELNTPNGATIYAYRTN